jgi:hypothetical protein
MNRILVAFALTLATAHAAVAASLADAVRTAPKDSWLVYSVPQIEGNASPCCFSWHDGRAGKRGCRLASGGWTFSDDESRALPVSGELVVYLHVGADGPDRVRAYAAECPVDTSGERIASLSDIAPASSVALLATLAEGASKRARGDAIGALALHAGAESDRTLNALATPGHAREVRKDASFWLGQTRGQAGFDAVRRMFASETDVALRKHWVFVLAQSDVPARPDTLRKIAREDASAAIRGDALFWMSQADVPGVEDEVRRALHGDKSAHVRKQAVFALSQLPGKRSVPALKALAADATMSREIRKEALFWLAQSDEDDAIAVFDQILR